MNIKDAKLYITNWKNIESFFNIKTLEKALEDFAITQFSVSEFVPKDNQYLINLYDKKGYYTNNKLITGSVREYLNQYGGGWERVVEKIGYNYIVPDRKQLYESNLINAAFRIEYPYMKKYHFESYHFDMPWIEVEVLKRKSQYIRTPVNENWFGQEIYVRDKAGTTKSLYVPIIALKEKNPELIVKRHSSYFKDYYKNPDMKKYLDESLNILNADWVKEFFADIEK